MNSILSQFEFDTVCGQHWDYVIVGSGLGGDILARQLVEDKRQVLLIEKGGLQFSTHCLNTARPHWTKAGSASQDNDVVYQKVKQPVETEEGSDKYDGGPVYCLGGRSNVWGLFAPELSANTLNLYVLPEVASYLRYGGFNRALNLMTNSPPGVSNYPDDLIWPASTLKDARKRLAAAIKSAKVEQIEGEDPNVETGPIAAEFDSEKLLYYFPQGAYSTVDYILDRLYAGNEYLTVLANTEVVSLKLNEGDNKPIQYAEIRETSGQMRNGKIFANKAIILCAGTIGTAAIAIKSGLQDRNTLVGKGLTDHEIWGVRFEREIPNDQSTGSQFYCGCILERSFPDEVCGCSNCTSVEGGQCLSLSQGMCQCSFKSRADVPLSCRCSSRGPPHPCRCSHGPPATPTQTMAPPMKLQSQVKIHGNRALLNVCINANSFLAYQFTRTQYINRNDEFLVRGPGHFNHDWIPDFFFSKSKRDTITVTLEFRSPLMDDNEVLVKEKEKESDSDSGSNTGADSSTDSSSSSSSDSGSNEPTTTTTIKIHREPLDPDAEFENQMCTLINAIRDEFVIKDKKHVQIPKPHKAGFGAVAHEVGTMRMDSWNDGKHVKGVVNQNLRFHKISNLYICDLSVFPFSPPANPSLTLAALAIRLAKHLGEKY